MEYLIKMRYVLLYTEKKTINDVQNLAHIQVLFLILLSKIAVSYKNQKLNDSLWDKLLAISVHVKILSQYLHLCVHATSYSRRFSHQILVRYMHEEDSFLYHRLCLIFFFVLAEEISEPNEATLKGYERYNEIYGIVFEHTHPEIESVIFFGASRSFQRYLSKIEMLLKVLI